MRKDKLCRTYDFLTAVAGLIVAVFIALLLLLDNPETYKETLSETFETQTGYGLQINGEPTGNTSARSDWFKRRRRDHSGLEIPLASLTPQISISKSGRSFSAAPSKSLASVDGLTVNATVDSNGRNWEVTVEELPSDESACRCCTNRAQHYPDASRYWRHLGDEHHHQLHRPIGLASDYLLELASFVTGPQVPTSQDLTAELRIEDKIANLVISNTLKGRFAINKSLDEFLLEELATNTKLSNQAHPPSSLTWL